MHTQSARGEIYDAWQWYSGQWLVFDSCSTVYLVEHDSAFHSMVGHHAQRSFLLETLDDIPAKKIK